MNTFLFLGDNNYRMEYHGILMQVLPSPLEGLLHEQLKDPTVFVHEASELWQL